MKKQTQQKLKTLKERIITTKDSIRSKDLLFEESEQKYKKTDKMTGNILKILALIELILFFVVGLGSILPNLYPDGFVKTILLCASYIMIAFFVIVLLWIVFFSIRYISFLQGGNHKK